MFIRPEQVLEQYDFEVKAVSRGRDSYICDTSQGMKTLKEYKGSLERADFLTGILAYLREQGILVESVTLTKEGTSLAVCEDGTKFILVDAFCGAECDTKNRDNMLTAVGQLAKMHQALEGYQGEVPQFVRIDQNARLLLYEKHNRELRKVKNYIRSKKKKNEFEVMFAGQYERFMEKAVRVTEQLKVADGQERIGFCHGEYNQHNVIFSKSGIAIVNCEGFSHQAQVIDLGNFMRKMLEKNNWNTGLGMDMISAYDNVRKLLPSELEYLYLYLAYPEKFWKIANHYYNAHKAWLSGRNIEKLEKLIRQEGQKEQFLEILFHFTS